MRRRQPVILNPLNICISRSSVARFSRLLTLAMILDRCDLENTSTMTRSMLVERALNFKGVAANEFGWQGVAYHKRNCLLPGSQVEDISAWKPLKEGGLSHRYGAVLFRMDETPFGGVKTPACNGGCDHVPSHPTVNVSEPVTILMTIQLTVLRQITPASTVLGNISD